MSEKHGHRIFREQEEAMYMTKGKPCVRETALLTFPVQREEKKKWTHLYYVTVRVYYVCPHLGFEPYIDPTGEEGVKRWKPRCAIGCKDAECCKRTWKGKIPYTPLFTITDVKHDKELKHKDG